MAGRGARPRKVIPNREFIEVQENMRLLKLFPDALELRDHFMYLRVKADEGKTWINQEKMQTRTPLPDGGWFQGGELINNKRNGYGIYSDLNGNLYEGVWTDNKKTGHFHCYYKNGERFEGQFENDKRNGEGVHYYPDGSQYSGDYMNDYRHGVGFYFSAAEFYTLQKMHFRKYNEGQLIEEYEVYTAQQRYNERPVNGFGTIVDVSGNKYEGDFVDSKKHGKGKVTAPNGDIFVGEFIEDMRHGLGMFKTVAGKYFYQSWHRDDLEYENETDKHNFENYLWYDEGGFSSHN